MKQRRGTVLLWLLTQHFVGWYGSHEVMALLRSRRACVRGAGAGHVTLACVRVTLTMAGQLAPPRPEQPQRRSTSGVPHTHHSSNPNPILSTQKACTPPRHALSLPVCQHSSQHSSCDHCHLQ